MKGFHFVSGLPIIGSLFILFAAILLPASLAAGVVLLFFSVFDAFGLFCLTVFGIRGKL